MFIWCFQCCDDKTLPPANNVDRLFVLRKITNFILFGDWTRVSANNIEDRSCEYGTKRSALVRQITCTMSPIEKHNTECDDTNGNRKSPSTISVEIYADGLKNIPIENYVKIHQTKQSVFDFRNFKRTRIERQSRFQWIKRENKYSLGT